MSHKKAVLITCAVALIWSLAGLNIKMIHWSGAAIAGGRSLISSPYFRVARNSFTSSRYIMALR